MDNEAFFHKPPSAIPPALVRRSTVGRSLLEDGVDSGRLTRIRRDAYVHVSRDVAAWEQRAAIHHAMLEAFRADALEGVIVLESAVLLHGGTTWRTPQSLHLAVSYRPAGMHRPPTRRDPTRPPSRELGPLDRRRALARRPVTRHTFPVSGDDVVTIGGLRVTGIERTIEDCARYLEPDAALVAVDSLLAVASGALPPAGVDPSGPDGVDRPWDRAVEINQVAAAIRARVLARLNDRSGERGVRRARAVIGAATPWSQSPYETELRRICLVNGITTPTPQMPLRTAEKTCYADLGWWSLRRVAEVDGLIKYAHDADTTKAKQSARDELFTEHGFELAHFSPDDVLDAGRALAMLRALLPRTACEERPVTSLRTKRERLQH
ncbi:Transcriptional regulator, AbiEi antitoxin, Type IV TA system [Actinomyces ruminicola]|uniref:Transcriptional regulator, AbiEi antitoxin, Type IV TA system n=1 Tax=Actinomyces ruminicola TaxID=332524 RepID=A0A1H0DLT5_9ACTO|nr:hypothetical protein [Actinomyces ruminicola]SDN71217.1 Transcriptional regulator, AbiEi antitoxin, Type IV TA system [Actinomyces ruminicola]